MELATLLYIFLPLLTIYYFFFKKEDKNYPPGPSFSLPIFGHLFYIDALSHITLNKWHKKYGRVISSLIADKRSVFISDVKVAKEAYNDIELSGRADFEALQALSGGKLGIINTEGPEWVEQRRFTLRHLRDFGFGKGSMEDLIMEEVNELLMRLKNENGKPVNIGEKFTFAVLNALWVILTGTRYSQDDPRLLEFVNKRNSSNHEIFASPFKIFFPQFVKKFPNITGWNNFLKNISQFHVFFKDMITDHQKTQNENESPRDFIDLYLREISKTEDRNSSFYKKAGEKSLLAVISDLFAGGTDTTTVTLEWAVLFMGTHKEVQKKVRDEITEVVGKERTPTLADRANMPYTESTIMEIFRKSSIFPFSPGHKALNDLTIDGYHIPKGTTVSVSVLYIHNDPKIWGDPEKFRPERFIMENGQCNRKHESMCTFSFGKRVCIGETLARDQLFLFFACLLQRFNIDFENGIVPSHVPLMGFNLHPQPYKVVLTDLL